ncbi:L-threonylcarbamoyladenylate synthase [Pacificibacter marinus]|uniref:L-threonylcarbamoyladenylate synthase n=1 Tax=Pacificibacter marinus TaxID=658057 RepID=UPI001C07C380|nr:L-threonylcarbamoyladenylate synthase [Pacificibacter marinus]MBU2868914.1 threonylcarbamoyl-AMP synthase [Pacificibacter marinus]
MSVDPRILGEAQETLTNGGVVLLPTDTVLGLVALPSDTQAVDKVYALKQRPRDKNLPIIVASADQITAFGGQITRSARACLDSQYMPGPLTIAIGLQANTTPKWLLGRAECAVRIPDDALLLALLTNLGPLMATSANLSGQDTPQTTQEAADQLNGTPDYVVAGHAKSQAPSTLVNCRVTPAKIERIGAVSEAEINAILEHIDD